MALPAWWMLVGPVATHVVIEPDGATAPAGETVTPGGGVPGMARASLLVAPTPPRGNPVRGRRRILR